MKRFFTILMLSVLALTNNALFAQENVTVVDGDDIPGGLSKATDIKLTGTWNTDKFQEFAISLGTTGFGATNKNLATVDMSEAVIEEGSKLYVSGGFSSNGVFVNCKSLTKVVMPAAAEAAKFSDFTNAFMNCDKLEEIDLSNCSGLTTINNAFYGCASLKEINIGSENLSKSSSLANSFEGCAALTKVTLPATITFATKTFKDCTSLAEIDWTSFTGTEIPALYYDMFDGISDLKAIKLIVNSDAYELFLANEQWSKLDVQEAAFSSVAAIGKAAVFFADGQITATSPISNVRIYNIGGILVKSIQNVAGSYSLNGLNPGVYVASFIADGQTKAVRFIVR